MATVEIQHSTSSEFADIPEQVCGISVIIPITERYDDLRELYLQMADVLTNLERSVEFIFIVDGPKFEDAYAQLCAMKETDREIRIIRFRRAFGEAAALAVGFEHARGETIITLSPYFQVEPHELLKMMAKLEAGADLVISHRYPRIDSILNRTQSYVFHWLIRRLTGLKFHDLSCGMRIMKREVAKELELYGDLHRFIPILAWRLGCNVVEVDVKQSQKDRGLRVVGIGIYIRRLLDILTVFFVTKFTKKPLRFFGLISFFMFAIGFFICLYLSIMKIMISIPLADRPLLIFGTLLMVIGIQIGSIGLVGEIVIFTHARQMDDYKVEKILE
jgi:glycosyltransferase involved in cell wall biosynthesis